MITIKLENTGPIKSAEFDIGGLTVLAGLNDTGKTFISKTIFSLIKTVKDSEQYLERSQEEQLESFFRKAEVIMKAVARPKKTIIQSEEKSPIKDEANNIVFYREFLEKLWEIDRGNDDVIDKRLNSLKNFCLSATQSDLGNEHKTKFTELLEEIRIFEGDLETKETNKAHSRCFDNFLNTTFKKNFNNLFSESAALISVTNQSNDELINVSVQNNKVSNYDFKSASSLPFKEITYLFSPIILQFFKFISLTTSRRYLGLASFGNSYRQEYEISKSLGAIIADLFSKLILSIDSLYSPEGQIYEFLKKMKDLTGGYLEYDDKERDFVFKFEKNGKETLVPVSNTAEGIKAFGILQLLLGVEGLVGQDSILLFDEPEVHLHPEWQIELAKLLVKLAEIGVPIFISSHSPYILEALYTYANRSNIIKEDFRLYYLEKDEDNGSILKNLTNEDPFPIFEKMSDAMDKINNKVED